ncbi:YbfB/YjiJ family MFS transporter [Denitromonas iodatirespirans]|uniref:YbfB/YjiJ family MFS transporter n=1 Tax=Denitromonas iodatirespirans TaxID=2795389 RepID=A0A944H9Z0_DENI1|nr:YbfB/YjiJ family MFS transporter [Denitromonas iodatirespirans]MBT0963968.1 YbfB/YjiJ family MFS transporter [Denitromonas iodatirespirans]
MSAPAASVGGDRAALRVALAGALALAVAMGIGRFAFTPMLPMMQVDAGLSLTGGGWLASANYLGYLVGALSAGRLALVPSQLFRGGLLAVVLSTAAMAVGDSFVLWLIWRFVAGVASAWVLVATASLALARLGAMGRPQLAGGVFAGVGLGVAAAGLVCMGLAAMGVSSEPAWLALAGIAAVGAALVWRPLGATTATEHGGVAPPRAQASFWHLSLAYGLLGFGYILPATFLPAQARALIADPTVFGWVWPVFGAAAAASTLLASRFAHQLGRRQLWALAHAVMAVGVALPVVSGGLWALVLAAMCVGGTFMVITMTAMQEARAVAGAAAPRLIADMTAAFALGQLLGPMVVSLTGALALPIEWPLSLAAFGLLFGAALLMRRDPQARLEKGPSTP